MVGSSTTTHTSIDMRKVWPKVISPNKGKRLRTLAIVETQAREIIICISQLQKFLIPKTSGTALTSIPIHCCVNKTYRSQRIRANMNESSQRTVRLSSNAIESLGGVRRVLALRLADFLPASACKPISRKGRKKIRKAQR